MINMTPISSKSTENEAEMTSSSFHAEELKPLPARPLARHLKRHHGAFFVWNGEPSIDISDADCHIQTRKRELFIVSILLIFPAGRSARNDLDMLHVLADQHDLLNTLLCLMTQ